MDTGSRIKLVREHRGLTQQKLGEMLGYGKSSANRVLYRQAKGHINQQSDWREKENYRNLEKADRPNHRVSNPVQYIVEL